jgi:GxxExxY protein
MHGDTTQKIIDAFYKVYNTLGYGFLEKVYENALAIILRRMGCQIIQQQAIQVHFEGSIVGQYYADLIVDGCVIVELKASEKIADEHFAQLINYLKATEIEVGLLLNFGPEPKFARKVFSNQRKSLGPASGDPPHPC